MKEAQANVALYFRGRSAKLQSSLAWNCGCDPSGTKHCISFNLKRAHTADKLDDKGRCKYLHKCDQYVLADDGTKVLCGQDHPRVACTNSKKVAGKQSGGGD